jgi:hypothetical protein
VIGKTTNRSRKERSANSELGARRRMRIYDSRADALLLFGVIQHLRFRFTSTCTSRRVSYDPCGTTSVSRLLGPEHLSDRPGDQRLEDRAVLSGIQILKVSLRVLFLFRFHVSPSCGGLL